MSFRDRAILFVEDHIRVVIAATAGMLLLLVLILGIALRNESVNRSDAKKAAAAQDSLKIRPEEFRLPSDPIPVPGLQRFRERKQAWSIEEARSWYREPSPESLEKLRTAAASQIEAILEAVP